MRFNIIIEKRAVQEIQDAVNYYEFKLKGLGEKFTTHLNSQINELKKNPFYQVRYKDYRALPLKKFPYTIVFYLSENKIYIISVFNTYQNPTKLP